MGSGNRTPGPHAYIAGTLLDELSPQQHLVRTIFMSQVYYPQLLVSILVNKVLLKHRLVHTLSIVYSFSRATRDISEVTGETIRPPQIEYIYNPALC